jgi:hypothetical protein
MPAIPTADFRIRSRRSTGLTVPLLDGHARGVRLRDRIGGVGLEADPVMEDEEREPEHPEGVLGSKLAVVHVHVELLVGRSRVRPPSPTIGRVA